jgi:hypothetical protein
MQPNEVLIILVAVAAAAAVVTGAIVAYVLLRYRKELLRIEREKAAAVLLRVPCDQLGVDESELGTPGKAPREESHHLANA